MSTEYPSIKAPLLGLIVCVVPFLWYFDWATWAWIVAGVFLAAAVCSWFSEALEIYRNKQEGEVFDSADDYRPDLVEDDDDDFLSEGKTIWEGSRHIRFAYSDHSGDSSEREVTVRRVVSLGRANGDTYFLGYCHLRNEPRTFRLDRIKSRKVTDTSTGEMATFRQLFGLRSR